MLMPRSSDTCPSSGCSCPEIIRNSVVLPAPFGPTRPIFSPFWRAAEASMKRIWWPTCLLTLSRRIMRSCGWTSLRPSLIHVIRKWKRVRATGGTIRGPPRSHPHDRRPKLRFLREVDPCRFGALPVLRATAENRRRMAFLLPLADPGFAADDRRLRRLGEARGFWTLSAPINLAACQMRRPKRTASALVCDASVPLEVLYGAFMLLGRRTRFERAEIAPFAGLRVHFARIEPVFAGRQFSDHGTNLPRRPHISTGLPHGRSNPARSRRQSEAQIRYQIAPLVLDRVGAAQPLQRPLGGVVILRPAAASLGERAHPLECCGMVLRRRLLEQAARRHVVFGAAIAF